MKYNTNELRHYGIEGMKWGIRRYQNPDGTRTELGKRRERKGGSLNERTPEEKKALRRKAAKAVGTAAAIGGAASIVGRTAVNSKFGKEWHNMSSDERAKRLDDILSRNQKDGKDKPNISLPERAAKEGMKAVQSGASAISRVENKRSAKRESERIVAQKRVIAKLSDDELRKRINRLNLEKQYLDLTRPTFDPNKWTHQEKIDLGTDILNGLLAAGGLAVSIYTLKKKLG